MTEEEALVVLRERRDWLAARIDAKLQVGWDVTWDRREMEALTWAIRALGEHG